MKYAWIKEYSNEFQISVMCRILKVDRASYYHWVKSGGTTKKVDKKLNELIEIIFVQGRGKALVKKLKEVIPRQSFEVPIQASINNKIIARETIKGFKKDVLTKIHGGGAADRKRKLFFYLILFILLIESRECSSINCELGITQ